MKENEDKYLSRRISVPAEYENIFSHFYVAENKSPEIVYKTFLPSFQTILIFNFGSKSILHSRNNTEVEVDKCLILGPVKQAFNYSLPLDCEILVANFKDDAFYRFFGNVSAQLPMHPDDLLVENCFTSLWMQLNEIKNVNDKIGYILEFCKPYLKQRNIIAEQIASFNDAALNSIKFIADKQNQTERNIQLNHKKMLGYTAKEMNRYQRFLKTIKLIESLVSASAAIDWFEIISECGYYDQSQLIHDFKHYLTISPTKYLKFQQDICIAKAE